MLASVEALLTAVIDYAGLFPPAKLNLQTAMANYAQGKRSAYGWMLGHFVLPVSQFNELAARIPAFPLERWSLSVILSREWQPDLQAVLSVNRDKIAIAALEFPPLPPTEIALILPQLPVDWDWFFEIPLTADLEAYCAVLHQTGAAAKIRTGGITLEAFPTAIQVTQAILAFSQYCIPFKATAGLHHPLPAERPLTSEPNSSPALMQGFLNIAILSALAAQLKITLPEAIALLQVSAIAQFEFREDSIEWSHYRLSVAEIQAARQQFFRCFGSCSFQDPIDDLRTLELL